MFCIWNAKNLFLFTSIYWRASLAPAAAVIPSPKAYIEVVEVIKLAVGLFAGAGWSTRWVSIWRCSMDVFPQGPLHGQQRPARDFEKPFSQFGHFGHRRAGTAKGRTTRERPRQIVVTAFSAFSFLLPCHPAGAETARGVFQNISFGAGGRGKGNVGKHP